MDYKPLVKRANLLNCLRRAAFRGACPQLHKGQLSVLIFIESHEGCTQCDVAKAMNVSAASVATSTKRMEKADLICKRQDENNLRCNKLYLTEKAKSILQYGKKRADSIDEQLYAGINEEEMTFLKSIYDKMIFNLTGESYVNVLDDEGKELQHNAFQKFVRKIKGE